MDMTLQRSNSCVGELRQVLTFPKVVIPVSRSFFDKTNETQKTYICCVLC